MTVIYKKEFDNDAVSFTFKLERTVSGKYRGLISRSDAPDPLYEYVVIENYDIELEVTAKDGRTIVTMDRKSPSPSKELPQASRASHQS